MPNVMNLLMVIAALGTGGAEWAFVRQANALVAAGCRVTCYIPYLNESSKALVDSIDPRVKVESLVWMTLFLHSVVCKLTQKLPLNVEQVMHSFFLRQLQRRHAFDIVNPHLHNSTQMVCAAFAKTPIKIVESDHGDYAFLMLKDSFLSSHELLLRRLDALVCPTRANLSRIAGLRWASQFRGAVIPYAYSLPTGKIERALPADGVFTFGMVSRGVPEKGWKEAIAAFAKVAGSSSVSTRLVLVGEGPHLDALRRDLTGELEKKVIFAGMQADPRPWIESFDVGLLPSCFAAESLPNVIIECLAQGKPVIATRVGGIAEMLGDEDQRCGLLVELDAETGRADIHALAAEMSKIMNDDILRHTLTLNAALAVQRYRPDAVAVAMVSFFGECLGGRRTKKV